MPHTGNISKLIKFESDACILREQRYSSTKLENSLTVNPLLSTPLSNKPPPYNKPLFLGEES